MASSARARIARVVARLPDADVRTALRFVTELAARRDPLRAALLAAPEEDEEPGAHELEALEEGLSDHESGRVYSSEQVKRELGL